MNPTRSRRAAALAISATLVTLLAIPAAAAPAAAATPKCGGKTATIVGTARGEVIRGTPRADVIVAKGGNDTVYGRGGNDTICGGTGDDIIQGQAGRDRLLGNDGGDRLVGGGAADRLWGGKGPDKLAGGLGNDNIQGQAGNDSIDGGAGYDKCYQGAGSGSILRCEWPKPKVLAIAYSDLDRSFSFGAGDVLISQLLDTSGDGVPSAGDTIKMGKYPKTFTPTSLSDFEDWQRTTHEVVSATTAPGKVTVTTTRGAEHIWQQMDPQDRDAYSESLGTQFTTSGYYDWRALSFEGWDDAIAREQTSPSRPKTNELLLKPSNGDALFIDVEVRQ